MRLLITNVLATALVLLGAGSASAISTYMTNDYLAQPLNVGDTVTVEVFLNADAIGIQLLSVGVQFDPAVFQYNPQPNGAPGTPTYILFGQIGTGMTAMSSQLDAQQDPWQLWPGATMPAGVAQVNINFADASFAGTYVTGLNIKIAEIQLEVIDTGAGGLSTIALTSTSGGNVLQVAGVVIPNPVSGDFQVTLAAIPEPTTAVLVGLGLLGLGVAGRRRA